MRGFDTAGGRPSPRLVPRGPLSVAIALAVTVCGGAVQAGPYGIGTPATPAQVQGWNIDVAPDGKNLPAGGGTLADGKSLYETRCAACHGVKGEGGLGDRLAGGVGTLADRKPVKTVGSFWPYATTLYDYIRRAMPLDAPQTLSNDEVYSVTAYVLALNGLWPDGAPANARTLLQVRMPNAGGFVADPRPDVR
ncbi:cytochrome C [Bordetella genomosp. 8]|uniref:Cytochrome C n=1 Tax=Bordetella genomosp. 8 TaxID=1416806 RepID=A0A1W6YI55_9BORD|nr:cytochrome c [Bordetella genomosp. 8]ARP80669.1 cytochrome C [Bordetella genomosp. 8]